jgi:hypothetical protein
VIDGDVRAQQRNEQVRLQWSPERSGPKKITHTVRQTVNHVAQLRQHAAGRMSRVPSPPRRIWAALLDEGGQHAIDERRMAAGLSEDEVDDSIRRSGNPLTEHVRDPCLDTGAVECAEYDGCTACRQRGAEGRQAIRSRPWAVGDDEDARLAGCQRGESGQFVGEEAVPVVDEHRGLWTRVGVGDLAEQGEPRTGEDVRERIEQDGLAGARGPDNVDAAQPLWSVEGLPQQPARRKRSCKQGAGGGRSPRGDHSPPKDVGPVGRTYSPPTRPNGCLTERN